MYLIGIEFEFYGILKRNHPRIERWALRLQQYQFKLRHRPGETNPADVLSRKPLSTLEKNSIAEDYVNFLTDHLVPKSMNRLEIEQACQND